MDEDEEFLHEYSDLNLYLQNLGFSDTQVSKNEGVTPTSKYKVSKLAVEVIDKDVMDQIEIITSKKLLFEEDILIVKNLLSNFRVGNNGLLKFMFQDLFGLLTISLSVCLYFAIGYYALVIISPFYAYKCADYFHRKNLIKVKLKALMRILEKNSGLLWKTVDLIKNQKNKFLLLQSGVDLPYKNDVNIHFHVKLKSNFVLCVNKMTKILVNSTKELIKKIELVDYLDAPEFYICNNFEKNFESDDPSKVCLLYWLVQSEFLRRIILSLIPNINLSQKNNYYKLEKILESTTVKLTKFKKPLEIKLQHAFNIGMNGYEFKLSKEKNAPHSDYTEKLISNIHDISKTFINVLVRCNFIEENITNDALPDCIEANLTVLQTAINDCQRSIENSFILLRKANAISDDKKQKVSPTEESAVNDYKNGSESSSVEKSCIEFDITKQGIKKLEEEEEIEINNGNLNKSEVGITDLDLMIEDDVFEAYVTNENHNINLNRMNEWDLDEVLKKKLKTEFSQNVMRELKNILVERAKNWKKRELNILKKKGLLQYNEDCFEEVEDKIEPEKKIKETFNEDVSLESKEEHFSFDKNTYISEDQVVIQSQNCFGNLKKEFLKDFSKSRKLIFTKPIAEEEFCIDSTHEETF